MTVGRLFVGNQTKSVDAKGRVSVPPAFRDILRASGLEGLYARNNLRSASVECGPEDWVGDLGPAQKDLVPETEAYEDEDYLRVGDAQLLNWDPEGRIALPKAYLEHAGISNQATFVGRRTHFEIWEPAAFEARKAKALARNAARLAQARGGVSA
jgi:MraZ protein